MAVQLLPRAAATTARVDAAAIAACLDEGQAGVLERDDHIDKGGA